MAMFCIVLINVTRTYQHAKKHERTGTCRSILNLYMLAARDGSETAQRDIQSCRQGPPTQITPL